MFFFSFFQPGWIEKHITKGQSISVANGGAHINVQVATCLTDDNYLGFVLIVMNNYFFTVTWQVTLTSPLTFKLVTTCLLFWIAI